jgi:hypothetical protein
LVGAAATVLVSIINAVFAFVGNQRAKRNENHLVATKEAVETLKIQTNGMQDKLLQTTGEAERAKGVLVGHAEADAEAAVEAETAKCQYKAVDNTCNYPGPGKA